MPQTDVKTEEQHFRIYTVFRDGKVFAQVWEFGGANRLVLDEAANDIEEAKRKCEEYVKGRIENCPPITWGNFQQPQVFVVT
jgi:hypothetical protein